MPSLPPRRLWRWPARSPIVGVVPAVVIDSDLGAALDGLGGDQEHVEPASGARAGKRTVAWQDGERRLAWQRGSVAGWGAWQRGSVAAWQRGEGTRVPRAKCGLPCEPRGFT